MTLLATILGFLLGVFLTCWTAQYAALHVDWAWE